MAIVRVALPVSVDRLFDYWLPSGLDVRVGSLVRARLAGRKMLGVAAELSRGSEVTPEKLAPVDEVLSDLPPLPADLCALARFVAAYYQQPIGQCFAQMVPALAAGSRRARTVGPKCREGEAAAQGLPPLNHDQQAALEAVLSHADRFAPWLLQGVTGSGKTEVYFAAAERVIASGGQVLLLVPEINLTPQLEQRVAAAFAGVHCAVLHSALAQGARRANWLAAAHGEAALVVGTRLAVFAPLPRLGLIIVDEEHDASFKQQDGVRYHARDVAIYRARLRAVPIVLGSATPSLESYAAARRGRYRALTLPRRAAGSALPAVSLVPNRAPDSREGLGAALRAQIGERLRRGEQSLVFINRRGYAPSLLCAACTWKAQCRRCAARLVVHRQAGEVRCHHCGEAERIPAACPECGNQDLLPVGFGTQRLERALAEIFPAARILRIDRDSTQRKDAFARMREAIVAGEVDILVGTQMLAKGHDFPRLTLVGVLGADNALYSAEFRATERLFALLEQVAGRAGRGALPGEVVVQTDFPEHPVFSALSAHDYDRLARVLLRERESLGLPPFAHLALLAAEASSRAAVDAFLRDGFARGRAIAAARELECEVYPPVSAALSRRAGLERGQLLVQSARRAALRDFLPAWRAELERAGRRRVRWSLDVDPLGFA